MAVDPRRCGRLLLIMAIGLIAATALDNLIALFAYTYTLGFKHTEFASLLRCGGYLPLWLMIAAALVLVDRQAAGEWTHAVWERGAALVMSPVFAGILCALIQLVIRRERPDFAEPGYHFRPFWDRPLYGGGLGMPSSHTSVAFAAAFVLARLFPGAAPMCYFFAGGTALARILSGAHFLSDTYVGVWVGMGATSMVWWLHRRFGTGRLLSHPAHDSVAHRNSVTSLLCNPSPWAILKDHQPKGALPVERSFTMRPHRNKP